MQGFWWRPPDATAEIPSFSVIRAKRETEHFQLLISNLPKPAIVDRLVEFYYDEFEVVRGSMHWPTFRGELSKFWKSVLDPNPLPEPDLSFASLLFSVLTCAASFMHVSELEDLGITLPDGQDSYLQLLDDFHSASMVFLRFSQFLEKPHLNGLLSIIAMRIYSHRRNKWTTYCLMSSMAMRAAEIMGLDKMGTAFEDEKRWKQDRELSREPNAREFEYGSHVLREVGRRVSWLRLLRKKRANSLTRVSLLTLLSTRSICL